MTVHHDNPEPDPETIEMPKGFCMAGDGRKNKLERGRTWGVTLGVQHQVAHPLQLFLLMGQITYPKRINHLMKTMQSVCWARNLWTHVSTDYSLWGPTPTMCLSATQTHSTFKNHRVAKTDVGKITVAGLTETLTTSSRKLGLYYFIEPMRLRKLFSLTSPLRLPLSITQSCLHTDWLILWVPSVEGMLRTRQGSKVLGVYQWTKQVPALEEFPPGGMGKADNKIWGSDRYLSKMKKSRVKEWVRRGGHWILNLSADNNVKNCHFWQFSTILPHFTLAEGD